MPETLTFAPLLLVVALAFAVPLLLRRVRRVRVPVVVGEILAGIAIGRSGLGWVPEHDPVLELLAEIGFVYLMFLAGMEVDFANLGGGRQPLGAKTNKFYWGPVPLGVLSFVLTLALSLTAGWAIVAAGLAQNPWMMALILSTTSLGVVMPVLKETGLAGSRFGQTILVAAMVADFATMLLITLLVAVLSSGLTVELLLIGLLFVVFFVIYRFGLLASTRLPRLRHALQELSHASTQIKVRAAFALMLVFVVLSETLGAEIILGAFLAGAIIALLRTPDDAELGHKLEAFGFGFFIPIFFITVGVSFDLSALLASPSSLLLVPLLLLAALAVKLVPALVFRRAFSGRESLAAGALLSARLSLIIAASAIGLRLGVISEAVNAAILLVAIVTVMAAPLVFLRLAPPRPTHAHPIVVFGAGDLGLQVAEHLRAHDEQILVLDTEDAGVERAVRRGLPAARANLTDGFANGLAHLEAARAVVVTFSDIETSLRASELARTTYGVEHVIAHVNTLDDRARFEMLGVKTAHPALDHAALLGALARSPAGYELLLRTDDETALHEVELQNLALTGQPLHTLGLPAEVLIVAIRRDDDVIVPRGGTELRLGDQLTLAGPIEAVHTARTLVSGEAV